MPPTIRSSQRLGHDKTLIKHPLGYCITEREIKQMLVTYDEIMSWYNQRKAAGLTIETPTLLERYKSNPATDIPAIPLCDTCRWHIAGLWGSEYCGGRPNCYNCDSWTMYRADDYYNPDDNDSWKDWRRKEI